MQQLTGHTFGKYKVIKVLGQGNMGTVYLAHDDFIGRDVAIKVANPEALAEENRGGRYRKLFFNEAKVTGMLRYPNIISVFDTGVEEEIWYIVMEYVVGGQTLHTHCKPDSLFPVTDVARLIFKCAKVLDFAHRKGVVHRDIKPKNILLTHDQEAKIGDFGVALLMHMIQPTPSSMGWWAHRFTCRPNCCGKSLPATNRTCFLSG